MTTPKELEKTIKELKQTLQSLEKELEKSHGQLGEVDKLKSEFISTISHELRTPLSITKEGISLILDKIPGDINESQRKILMTAQNNVNRLAGIIQGLLDVAKLEEGKIQLLKEMVNLHELMGHVEESFKDVFLKKGLTLTIKRPEHNINIFIDRDKILQVFKQLLHNALRFTDKGYTEILVEQRPDCVEFMISDTGIGIAKDDLPKVFNKFQQFKREAGAGEKGTGIGLTITRAIVQKHGGKIWAESQAGLGSRFIFTLPKYPTEEIFLEYVRDNSKEMLTYGKKMSLVFVSIVNWKEIQGTFPDLKIRSIFENFKRICQEEGCDSRSLLFYDNGEMLIVFKGCDQEKAQGLKIKLQKEFNKYLTQEALKNKIKVRISKVTYPDEARRENDLIKLLRDDQS